MEDIQEKIDGILKGIEKDKWGYSKLESVQEAHEKLNELSWPIDIEMDHLFDGHDRVRRYIHLENCKKLISEANRTASMGLHK